MRLKMLLAVVLALIAVSPSWAQTLSREAFRDAYMAEVRRQDPSVTVKATGPDRFEIQRAGENEPVTAFTANAYARYSEDPSLLEEVVRAYADTMLTTRDKTTYKLESLRLVVRPNSWLSPLGQTKNTPTPLHRPLVGDLIVMVAVDSPEAIAIPAAENLRERLKMDDDAAIWARAAANTFAGMPRMLELKDPKAFNVYAGDDGYGASLPLMDELWADLDRRGVPVLVAPVNKNEVLMVHRFESAEVDA